MREEFSRTRRDFGDYADTDILFGKEAGVSCMSGNLLQIEGWAVTGKLAHINRKMSASEVIRGQLTKRQHEPQAQIPPSATAPTTS